MTQAIFGVSLNLHLSDAVWREEMVYDTVKWLERQLGASGNEVLGARAFSFWEGGRSSNTNKCCLVWRSDATCSHDAPEKGTEHYLGLSQSESLQTFWRNTKQRTGK